MRRRKKKHYDPYELTPEDKERNYKQITIFEALKNAGGGLNSNIDKEQENDVYNKDL